ncbi:hypothetical protein B0J13DRAFT_558524 [Dactylonectria estremocensis]|uniref:F-box domain-containing protein n=1 Tax=Dactylonectria estremocensis TaxID=1079267 RepID=A0A9P9J3D3_9HYPO|nr:hypothetical protein B0J13DRAFT_558524 [Dactylonectria estremocensis]
MRQPRITAFFSQVEKRSSPHNVSSDTHRLLALPSSIRRKIYREATARSDDDLYMDLNYWTYLDDEFPEPSEADFDAREDESAMFSWLVNANWQSRVPIGLLQTSRAIYEDFENALYSEYYFGVSICGPGGLDVLETISPGAIKALRFLTVRLVPCGSAVDGTTCQCLNFGSEPRSRERLSALGKLELFLDVHRHCEDVTKFSPQWERICHRLGEHVKPGRLSLYLICQADSIERARPFVEPLRGLPTLKDLGIRFGEKDPNQQSLRCAELDGLAKAIVLQAKKHDSFPFQDLPVEIQLRILKHTPLVSSLKMTFQGGRYSRRQAGEPEFDIAEEDRRDDGIRATEICRKWHVGFRERCCCDQFPLSFFLVSKHFRHLAMGVFYSENRIVVACSNLGWCASPRSRPGRVVVNPSPTPDVLSNLRKLSLVCEADMFSLVHPVVGLTSRARHFISVVDFLLAHGNLPRLTLEFILCDIRRLERRVILSLVEVLVSQPEKLEPGGHYNQIFDQLKRLAAAGLKTLFVYLYWNSGDRIDDVLIESDTPEKVFERWIMGNDYDSSKWATEQRPPRTMRPLCDDLWEDSWYGDG